jgi:hypothetical protein
MAVADGVMRYPPAHRMGVGQPAEELGHLPAPLWPDHKVDAADILLHDPLERLEIIVPAVHYHPSDGTRARGKPDRRERREDDAASAEAYLRPKIALIKTSCVPVSLPGEPITVGEAAASGIRTQGAAVPPPNLNQKRLPRGTVARHLGSDIPSLR